MVMGEAEPGGMQPGASNGPPQPVQAQPPKCRCPQCGSAKVWRDGLRYLADGSTVQRWLCRCCGFRFSEPAASLEVKLNITRQSLEKPNPGENLLQPNVLECELPAQPTFKNLPFKVCENVASHGASSQTVIAKVLNNISDYNRERRVCAWAEQAKNSAGAVKALEEEAYAEKRAAGATETSQTADIKGKLVEFAWWMKKQGYSDATIEGRVQILKRLVRLGANLFDPESVKDVIARQRSWSEGRRFNAIVAYTTFLQMHGLSWQPPRCRPIRKLPFIPLEVEIDQLIAGCSRKVGVFLQLLKETGMRSGEAWRLKWTDLDLANNTIRVTPEKGSEPRIFKISSKLAAMLNNLPKNSERIFGSSSLRTIRRLFQRQRQRLAQKLGNPRLLNITFHTLRHWKATMEYHRTKDILYVMKVLGHKNIKNTLIYTQLVNFPGEDEFVCKAARTVEEAKQLIEAGFDYVCDIENVKLFRKRK